MFILTIVALIFVWLLISDKKENLRIHGSYDIRGDPWIPYNPMVGPWNIGSSQPKRRRRMIIG